MDCDNSSCEYSLKFGARCRKDSCATQRTATQSKATHTNNAQFRSVSVSKATPIMNTVCICSSWSQFYFDIGRPIELWLSTSTQVASLLGDIGIRTCLRSDSEWHGLYGLDWRLDGGLGDSAVFSLGCKSWLAFLSTLTIACRCFVVMIHGLFYWYLSSHFHFK